MRVFKKGARRNGALDDGFRASVKDIIDNVRARGDAALAGYSARFDGAKTGDSGSFRVKDTDVEAALSSLTKNELDCMKKAITNIRTFAELQRVSISEIGAFEASPGVILGQRLVPVRRVCCYVPAGRFPLYSTAMMLVCPAKAAGVPNIALTSAPVNGGVLPHPKILAAGYLAGADEFYALGGAHAVAAFCYGTRQIKRADLIVGPGNAFVSEAKRQCVGSVDIDFVAGPSEVMIIADDSANAALCAADILAQCEHDTLAQGILVCTSARFAQAVCSEIEKQLQELPSPETAKKSWEENGEAYIADSMEEAVNIANERAPEHLELQTKDNEALIPRLYNYGSLFIGSYSAEVFGDYIAGANHTLPTLGGSRWSGGLWTGTFLKALAFQKLSAEGAANLAPDAVLLARGEGLHAHAAAAAARSAY